MRCSAGVLSLSSSRWNRPEVQRAVERAFRVCAEEYPGLTVEDGVAEHISFSCGGDVRKALNAVEMLVLSAVSSSEIPVATLQAAKEVSQRSSNRYDRDGDVHYDLLSALQKSIRGSDENAALHYLARLLDSGDLISPCRRILVCASEDIGLAYPMAVVVVKPASMLPCSWVCPRHGFPWQKL